MTLKFSLFATLASAIALSFSSCSPYQQQGAGIGALGGAALGAIAGDDSRDVIRGAAIGAAAGTGYAAYKENQQRGSYNTSRNRYEREPYSQPRPSYQEAPAPQRPNYPFAKRTTNPNIVISPYPPYNSIDISGLDRNDTLAKDTSAGKIFRIPR